MAQASRFYKVYLDSVTVKPISLRSDGIDTDGQPFDAAIHHETENQAVFALKAACRGLVNTALGALNNAILKGEQAERDYEAAIMKNSECIQRYSYESTCIE